jgi:hypothetical protein
MTTNRTNYLRADIWRGLIVAAVLLGAALAARRLSPEYVSPELARRSLGVLMGSVVVFYANAVPKALTPLIEARCDPTAGQAIRRFVGWILVFGGAAYAVAWAIAPFKSADMFAAGFLAASLLLVFARIAWSMRNKHHA